MFRLPLLVALSLLIAFGGGIWSTLVALDATVGFGAIKLGAWEAFPQAQTIDADPYAKAHRANGGKLLLGSAEGLSFTASVDDAGARLDGNCTYVISGQTPPTRAWTLFVTGEDRLPPSPDAERPQALNSRIVLRRADGSFEVTVAPSAFPGNWLSTTPNQPFRLVLTLLDTPTAGSSGLIDLTMPKLTKTGCSHA
ncbi:DUF1214 domain-containing protein [Rhizobium lemnae]|uniref:DUF1214 domain-containing protein n=1 Tax=Rhizobium lemnae TaxID=1214924 RepID=A0ABV8E2J8_9HYPH|nr:DUF1214 domain-containing protein [Rhizobium lemnae]MCJ8507550.1 DUF1214 domain-containing protein [Rhizobium lemnae]